MAKHKINLKTSAFKKLHSSLKKLEKANANFTIEGLSISSFLVANTTIDDQTDTAEIRTKRRILQIAGNTTTNPATLANNIKLVANLLYGDNEYVLLQMSLDALVKEYNAASSISSTEAGDCATVGDCTALVDSKIE